MELLSGKKEKLLFLSITFLGISHIVTQLVVMREFLNVFQGNELVFGIVLGNWLLLMGAGSWLGRLVKNVRAKTELLIFSQIGVALLPLLAIFLIRMLKVWVFMPGVALDMLSVFLSSFFILLPYSLLSGFLLTLACSVFSLRKTEEQIGSVYFIDNIGDIIGGVLFSFLFVFFLNPFQMAFAVMVINLLAAVLLSDFIKKRMLSFSVLALLVMSSASFAVCDINAFTTAGMYPGQTLVHQESSPYGNIVITRTGNQLNFFENGLPLFSTQNTVSNEETVHYAMVQHDRPERVLLISGGVAGTIGEIAKYGVESIDYVELDPLIIRLGSEYAGAVYSDEVSIINGDGRFYVKNTDSIYDVVIIDLPGPSTAQINRFYTLEFFRELKNVMHEDGVVTTSLASSVNYLNPETVMTNSILYSTLKSVFSNVIVIPGDDNYFVASDSELSYDIAEKIRARDIDTLYVNENYLSGKLTAERIEYVLDSIAGGDTVNTDFTPVAYYYHLMYWLSHFETNYTPLVLLAVIFAAIIFLIRGAISFAISTTGFAASSLEIVVLVSFQILFGYVYQNIGIIVTAFMLGLAVGAYRMNKNLHKKSKADLVKLEFAIFAYSLILPVILVAMSAMSGTALVFISSQIVFPAITFIIAVLVGMEFPLASKLHLKKKDVEHTAGTLYASDLAGAFIGALFASALLIPLLGIINVCIIVAALNLASGIVVWKKS